MSVFSKTGESAGASWMKDHMHNIMYDISSRSLRANMIGGSLVGGALGGSIGSLGGAMYGDSDTNVLVGAGVGGLVGALGGAAGMYSFKAKANQYALGMHDFFYNQGNSTDLMGKYNKNYFTMGEPLVNANNKRSALPRPNFLLTDD